MRYPYSEEFKKQFEHVASRWADKVIFRQEKLKKAEDDWDEVNALCYILGYTADLGVYKYLLGESESVVIEGFKDSLPYMRQMFEKSEIYQKEIPSYYGNTCIEYLRLCVNAGDFSLGAFVAEKNRQYLDFKKPHYYVHIIYHYLDLMLTGYAPESSIEEHLNVFLEKHKNKPKDKLEYSLGILIQGILKRDEAQTLEGIYLHLEEHENFCGGYDGVILEDYISYNTLALANLARALGMKCNPDHQYLPNELLLDYETLQTAYQALPKH